MGIQSKWFSLVLAFLACNVIAIAVAAAWRPATDEEPKSKASLSQLQTTEAQTEPEVNAEAESSDTGQTDLIAKNEIAPEDETTEEAGQQENSEVLGSIFKGFRIFDITGVGGTYLRPGDYVDVLMTLSGADKEVPFSATFARRVQIHAINDETTKKGFEEAPSSKKYVFSLRVPTDVLDECQLAQRLGTLSLHLRPFNEESDYCVLDTQALEKLNELAEEKAIHRSIPAGHRIFDVTTRDSHIQPGDYVDILLTTSSEDFAPQTQVQTLAENVNIWGVHGKVTKFDFDSAGPDDKHWYNLLVPEGRMDILLRADKLGKLGLEIRPFAEYSEHCEINTNTVAWIAAQEDKVQGEKAKAAPKKQSGSHVLTTDELPLPNPDEIPETDQENPLILQDIEAMAGDLPDLLQDPPSMLGKPSNQHENLSQLAAKLESAQRVTDAAVALVSNAAQAKEQGRVAEAEKLTAMAIQLKEMAAELLSGRP
ncbi:MAG: RcpC/CpaB family pilus assembly protein [Planctomycetota bacterium]